MNKKTSNNKKLSKLINQAGITDLLSDASAKLKANINKQNDSKTSDNQSPSTEEELRVAKTKLLYKSFKNKQQTNKFNAKVSSIKTNCDVV